jgi:hypothetical protein
MHESQELDLARRFAVSVGALAQIYTGSIAGRITDQTGGVLPGVTVTVTSARLLQPQTAVTSDSGAYRFTELPVSGYTVTFEISVTTGGQDPSLRTAGTAISFIIKQGTNNLKGQASFYGTDDSLQGSNVDHALRAQGAGAGAPIKYILDYGVDAVRFSRIAPGSGGATESRTSIAGRWAS